MDHCPRQLSAIVFDMDGLMFNTEDIYDLVGQQILDPHGKQFTLSLKQEMMGRKEPDAYRILKQLCNLPESVETLMEMNDRLLKELIPRHIQKLPGLDRLMHFGRQSGRKLGVATSSGKAMADAKLGHFSMANQFDHVVTGDQVTHGKPHPEIYREIARRLQVPTDQMLVLEDSVAGVQAATASGAWAVAVPGKHCQNLDYSDAFLVVERLDADEVVDLLNRCPIHN